VDELNYLMDCQPTAQPVEFEFEGRIWQIWPYDTLAILLTLERFVIQSIRRFVEKLRPADDDTDLELWTIYNEDKQQTLDDIKAGLCGAMQPRFKKVIETGIGWRNSIYECVRYKEKDWTPAHVARLFNYKKYPQNIAKLQEIQDLWNEINYPKVEGALDKPQPDIAESQEQKDSAGTTSCGDASETLESLQAS
jgi:hypothetical protein